MKNSKASLSTLLVLATLISATSSFYASSAVAGPEDFKPVKKGEPVYFVPPDTPPKDGGTWHSGEKRIDGIGPKAAAPSAPFTDMVIDPKTGNPYWQQRGTNPPAPVVLSTGSSQALLAANANAAKYEILRDMHADAKRVLLTPNELTVEQLNAVLKHGGAKKSDYKRAADARRALAASLASSEALINENLGMYRGTGAPFKIVDHGAIKGLAMLVEENPGSLHRHFIKNDRFLTGTLVLTGSDPIPPRAARMAKAIGATRRGFTGAALMLAAQQLLASESQSAVNLAEQSGPAPAVTNATTSDFAARNTSR